MWLLPISTQIFQTLEFCCSFFSHFLHDANSLVSLFIVYAKVILCSTRANDLSGTQWWFWHQCSHLMGKVTNLPKTWFVHFYVPTFTLPFFSPYISSRESERGGCRSVIHGHVSLVSVIQTKAPCRAPRVLPLLPLAPQLPLPPLSQFTPCKRWTGQPSTYPGAVR